MLNRFSQFLNAAAKREISFEIDPVPLHFQKLSLKKICNWVLTEGSIIFKPGRQWSFPAILQLEPTSFCNLRCRVCPVGIGLDRPSGNMDMPGKKRTIFYLCILCVLWLPFMIRFAGFDR